MPKLLESLLARFHVWLTAGVDVAAEPSVSPLDDRESFYEAVERTNPHCPYCGLQLPGFQIGRHMQTCQARLVEQRFREQTQRADAAFWTQVDRAVQSYPVPPKAKSYSAFVDFVDTLDLEPLGDGDTRPIDPLDDPLQPGEGRPF